MGQEHEGTSWVGDNVPGRDKALGDTGVCIQQNSSNNWHACELRVSLHARFTSNRKKNKNKRTTNTAL